MDYYHEEFVCKKPSKNPILDKEVIKKLIKSFVLNLNY
jgi:hypothetical protein